MGFHGQRTAIDGPLFMSLAFGCGPESCDQYLAALCAKAGEQHVLASHAPARVAVGIRWPVYKDNCCLQGF